MPTLVSENVGKGATKLATAMFEVPMPKIRSSVMSMATEPDDPGLLTDVIFKPIAFVSVFPTNDAVCVELPPFALTFEKLYDNNVVLVAVSTTSTPMLIGTAQLFVKDKSMEPPEKVTLVKLPKLPPL